MKTHVFGMAKSPLNLKGNKRRSLKLDFLQLADAVMYLRGSGKSARAFLVVLSDEVKRGADKWKSDHKDAEWIEIICPSLSDSEREQLLTEKARNDEGNKRSKKEGGDPKLASALFGAELGERKLREEIERRFPGIREVLATDPGIAGIRWDYYGLHDS